MRRLLVLAALLVAFPAGAVTVFSGGGAYYFNGSTDEGVVVNGDSLLDIVAPASLTEPGAPCDPDGSAALCVGNSTSQGDVNVHGGFVEGAVLANGYIGVSDGVIGSISSPQNAQNFANWQTVHVFGGQVDSISFVTDFSYLSFNLFDGTVGHVALSFGSVAISGGSLGGLSVFGWFGSPVDIHGGQISGRVYLQDWSDLLIDGGTFLGTEDVLHAVYRTYITLSGGGVSTPRRVLVAVRLGPIRFGPGAHAD